MLPSSPRKRRSWRRFWRYNFCGRVLLLAFSSGVGGFVVGGLIGYVNSLPAPSTMIFSPSGASYAPGPHWPTVIWDAFYNAIWMVLLGILVGFFVFAITGLTSSRWSLCRKGRLARGMVKRLLIPLTGSLIFTSTLAGLLYVSWQRGFGSELGNVLEFTGMATLPLCSCLLTVFLAYSSKYPRRKKQLGAERLLPLD